MTDVEHVDARFMLDSLRRTRLTCTKYGMEIQSPLYAQVQHARQEKLAIDEMRKAAEHFLGEHDFAAYTNAKSNKKKTIRHIYSLNITENEGFIDIRVRGNGFLYNMVRKIVGTLIEVGMGEKQADEVPDILLSKERVRTGRMAEACGLYLETITYE